MNTGTNLRDTVARLMAALSVASSTWREVAIKGPKTMGRCMNFEQLRRRLACSTPPITLQRNTPEY